MSTPLVGDMLFNSIRNFLGKIAILLLLSLIIAAVVAWLKPIPTQNPAKEGVIELTIAEAMALEPLWVDARSPHAYLDEHVPGAVNISLDAWDTGLLHFANAWKPGKVVVAYCDGGPCVDSHQIAKKLAKAIPQLEVYVLKGGFPSWQSQ